MGTPISLFRMERPVCMPSRSHTIIRHLLPMRVGSTRDCLVETRCMAVREPPSRNPSNRRLQVARALGLACLMCSDAPSRQALGRTSRFRSSSLSALKRPPRDSRRPRPAGRARRWPRPTGLVQRRTTFLANLSRSPGYRRCRDSKASRAPLVATPISTRNTGAGSVD